MKNIKKAMEEFAILHPEYATSEGSRGQAVKASIQFMELLGLDADTFPDHLEGPGQRSVRGEGPVEEHYWVRVDDLNIDWTARQFHPKSDFPIVWQYP